VKIRLQQQRELRHELLICRDSVHCSQMIIESSDILVELSTTDLNFHADFLLLADTRDFDFVR